MELVVLIFLLISSLFYTGCLTGISMLVLWGMLEGHTCS